MAKATLEQRFWEKVDRRGPDECWPWRGHTNREGYGRFAGSAGKIVQAHRFAYMLVIGPILDGLTLDHLCRNRECVNPAHLEPVTNRENNLRGNGWSGRNVRKTHCAQGHRFDVANTYIRPNGSRRCRTCKRQRERRRL